MDNGYVQVYTGNGKGKTTCALGLALRAVGAGKKVYIGQFMKDDLYSEIAAIREHLPMVTLEQYGSGGGFLKKGAPPPADIEAAVRGYERAKNALLSGLYDVVILDEINMAAYFELITEADVIFLIEKKPSGTELVLTGRYASERVIKMADLVTEMTEIKHYYQKGVAARTGIEK